MQWTNDNGSMYVGDGYGTSGYGYGYEYGHGYQYGYGSTATDTATMPWPPTQFVPWMDENAGAYPAAEMAPTATAWDVPDQDVLTGPPPHEDEPDHTAPDPGTPSSETVQPVFVDSSGRRPRRVRRVARLMVIPAGGYVALLVSTMLGGPAVSAPSVPLTSDSIPSADPTAPVPDATHSTGKTSITAAQKTSRFVTASPGSVMSAAAYQTKQAPSASPQPQR